MKRHYMLDSTQIVALGFIILILVGAIILTLPICSQSGKPTDFLSCLFTSTSASCITGLVVVDTATHWNGLGQLVVLLLIQTGGLGFMSLATLFSLIIKRNISFKERMVAAQSLNLFDFKGVVRLVKHILLGTLGFEGAGAIILSSRFIPEFGFFEGIWKGIFCSVSAFCNAGFDLMGKFSGKFSSLTAFSDDLVVCLTIMLLIITGGLGFIVWEEIFTVRKFSKFSLFSKVVITTTICLITFGAVFLFFSEFSNPETFGAENMKGKVLAAFFQSVSPRTAGFNTVPLAPLRDVSKVVIIILMFIGASSGSTGGGVKVSTIGVISAALFSMIKGEKDVTVFKRKISDDTVFQAFALVFSAIALLLGCCFIISLVEVDIPFLTILFECVSAFATVGLSVGTTSAFSPVSKIVLILLMYLGRVGLITFTYAIFTRQQRRSNKLQYPEGKITIG